MRFLCKKCGAQSPGDISEVEIREGALIFTCKACGASATLVESRGATGKGPGKTGQPAEKGIVEPDEDELVELGEATLSRMLGKKVRIVAEGDADPVGAATDFVPEESPVPTFAMESDPPVRRRRPHVYMAIAASVGLVAVAAVALLEARPQRLPSGGAPVSVAEPGRSSSPPPAPAEPASAAIPPGPSPAASPSAVPAGSVVREGPDVGEPAPRLGIRELADPTPHPAEREPRGPGLSPHQIEEAFFRVRPAVRMCALQEQRRHPGARLGTETVALTVAPTGEVTRVEFESPGLADTPLGACLAVELKRFRVEAFDGPPAVVRSVLELSRPGASSN